MTAERLARAAAAASKRLRPRLRAWFRRSKRDLPFRRTTDPYRIWISEIILQQTRMEAGVAYYERFIRALPTVEALAYAKEETVLKLWEGLGYYTRARNLHRAAREAVKKGGLPVTAAGWAELPGVGPYTAGAVASIAFGESAAAVDGNVKRVLARLFAYRKEVDSAEGTAALWEAARALLPKRGAGEWNQALMELGALVCLPGRPRCGACPLKNECQATAENLTAMLPCKKRKRVTPHKRVVAAAVRHEEAYLVGRRREGGMLAGLWEFPGGAVRDGETEKKALARTVRESTGVTIRVGREIARVEHAYSHFRMTLSLHDCTPTGGEARTGHYSAVRWVKMAALQRLAMPQADRKAALSLPE